VARRFGEAEVVVADVSEQEERSGPQCTGELFGEQRLQERTGAATVAGVGVVGGCFDFAPKRLARTVLGREGTCAFEQVRRGFPGAAASSRGRRGFERGGDSLVGLRCSEREMAAPLLDILHELCEPTMETPTGLGRRGGVDG